MNFDELTGRVSNHLISYQENEQQFIIDKDTLKAFKELKSRLKPFDINLSLVSSYRSFEAQKKIWNEKATGKRKLLSRTGETINYDSLSDLELIEAIMTWSALPGASRHHWGTEIDIFDSNIKEKSFVSLTIDECENDFKNLYTHLNQELLNSTFYRPYSKDLGGVSREPWHLSLKNKSDQYFNDYSLDVFIKNIQESNELVLKETILENANYLFDQYIQNITK